MYQYRVKIPTFLLGCLLLVALINCVSDLRVYARAGQIPLDPPSRESAAAFETRLNATTDPAELRALAAKEHRTNLAADRLIAAFADYLKTSRRTLLIQGGGTLALLVLYYLLEYRMPPPPPR